MYDKEEPKGIFHTFPIFFQLQNSPNNSNCCAVTNLCETSAISVLPHFILLSEANYARGQALPWSETPQTSSQSMFASRVDLGQASLSQLPQCPTLPLSLPHSPLNLETHHISQTTSFSQLSFI